MVHALRSRPKSLEHRAKIAASKRVDQDTDPERWQAEFKLALKNLKERNKITKKFSKTN